METQNVKIIYEIRENPDKYTPNQISCFNRPWAILFSSISQEYYYMYLFWSTFYQLFMVDCYFDWRHFINNLDDNFFNFSQHILLNKFGCEIEKKTVDNNLNEMIKQSIDNQYRVLLPVDLFYLPYYSGYMNNNHIHFIPIKGYDTERKLYYILDNMHIDRGASPTYSDFVLTWDCISNIYDSVFDNFFCTKNKYFWILKKANYSKYNFSDLLKEYKDILIRIIEGESSIRFAEEYLFDSDFLEIKNNLREYTKIINYKHVYYDTLFYFLRQAQLSEELYDNLVSKSKVLISCWNDIRMKVIYYLSKSNEIPSELIKDITENISREKDFIAHTIYAIDTIGFNNDISVEVNLNNSKKKLNIYNPFNANIQYVNDKFVITHTKEKSFDTWINQDNAPQILANIANSNNSFSVACKVTINKIVDPSFAGGIIIKCKNGERYLFGLVENNSIQLHCPNRNKDYMLLNIMYSGCSVYLKVTKELGIINFYYKRKKSDKWISIYKYRIFEITEVGYISKTWDQINHTTTFSECEIVLDGQIVEVINI